MSLDKDHELQNPSFPDIKRNPQKPENSKQSLKKTIPSKRTIRATKEIVVE